MNEPRARYGRDDFIACLAFAGPPVKWSQDGRGVITGSATHAERLALRVDQIELVETFCIHWFTNRPEVDGQWANFFTNYENWYSKEKANVETHRMARNHSMFGCGDLRRV